MRLHQGSCSVSNLGPQDRTGYVQGGFDIRAFQGFVANMVFLLARPTMYLILLQ